MFSDGISPDRMVARCFLGDRDLISMSPSSPTIPSGEYPRVWPSMVRVTKPASRTVCPVCFWYVSRAMGSSRWPRSMRSEEHTSELQSRFDLVCRLLLEKKKEKKKATDRARDGRGARRQ